ncbi:MAG: esterase-like activity of phytase family protein [Hyphomicrobiaceae bacterium]
MRTLKRWWQVSPAGAVATALFGILAFAHAAPTLAQSPPAAATAPTAAPDDTRAIEVTARRIVAFDRGSGDRRRFGRLEYRGGLVLTSSVKAFGGYSGLTITPDGRRFLAVSDEGTWLAADIVYEGTTPSAIQNARIGPIHGIGGRNLSKKRDLDAEAITLLDGTLARGTVLIGFERNHRIGRFPVIDGVLQNPAGYLKLPPEAKRMRTNKGFESVAVMQGGPYKGSPIAFSERFPDNPTQHAGWIWIRGEPQRLGFMDIGEFEVTDAASLADGTLLVLERRFRWTEGVKMRLRRFAPDQVRPGAVMQGDTLIDADLSFEIDNMEGLAVHRSARGETVLTLISDDNFNAFLQRTILLQFTLVEDAPPTTARR